MRCNLGALERCRERQHRIFDLGTLSIAASHSRQPSGSRLEHLAHLTQFQHEQRVGNTLRTPRHHIRIEQLPTLTLGNERAQARAGIHKTFGREYLDRFADNRAAHLKIGKQSIRINNVARNQSAAHNATSKHINNVPVQASARESSHHRDDTVRATLQGTPVLLDYTTPWSCTEDDTDVPFRSRYSWPSVTDSVIVLRRSRAAATPSMNPGSKLRR